MIIVAISASQLSRCVLQYGRKSRVKILSKKPAGGMSAKVQMHSLVHSRLWRMRRSISAFKCKADISIWPRHAARRRDGLRRAPPLFRCHIGANTFDRPEVRGVGIHSE